MRFTYRANEIATAASGKEKSFSVKLAFKNWALLVKFRLSLMVLFSALISFGVVGGGQAGWRSWLLLAVGGFLVTGAANALNQVLEYEYDALMRRTALRPVASGQWSVATAVLVAGLMASAGLSVLAFFNPLTAFLGALSLVTYAFLYTPLKRYSPVAVLVGAIPGALPVVIGTVAWEKEWSAMASFLFAVQFLWQFPHFWAVAWVADQDYKRAGFYLLPTKESVKSPSVGLLSFLFCVLLALSVFLAYAFGQINVWAMGMLILVTAYFAWSCWGLFRRCADEAARKQMYASFLYLPLALLTVLADALLSHP